VLDSAHWTAGLACAAMFTKMQVFSSRALRAFVSSALSERVSGTHPLVVSSAPAVD